MKSEFGNGGSTKVDGSSNAAPINETFRNAFQSSPASATVKPPIRCFARVGASRPDEERAHLIGRRPADRVGRRDGLDQRATGFVAGGQRLREHVVGVADLHPALTHHRDERVVFALGLFHPEHVVEEQLVVIGGGQTLEAEIRAMDHHLAEFSDFGMNA